MACNGDALLDLFPAGGQARARLFRNRGDFAFEPGNLPRLTGVTGTWPLVTDADGLIDLAVLRVGENLLLRGTGDCRFERGPWAFDGGDA